MNTDHPAMTIIGAGSYGTALAITLARNGHSVILWSCSLGHAYAFPPGITSPPKHLLPDLNLAQALMASRDVLIAVPSDAFSAVLNQIKPHLRKDARAVWATKGLEANTGRLLQDVAREILGETIPLAVISGPTFAKELAAGCPTAIVLSSTHAEFSKDLQQLLHDNERLRVYSNPDIIGVQLGGAVKNVIAIGVGISDGLNYGANARAALITCGLEEMKRLGCALGAKPSTFMGMAGLGDLVLTCTDNQSRNRKFGMMLGQGEDVKKAQNKIGSVVEGCCNTKGVWKLANRHNVKMPITELVYQVLCDSKKASEAAAELRGCTKKITGV